jgi:multisite-specific tRNA:(cytosine-C5)-methyltransferase
MTADKQRAGCGDLFAAVARARPRVHCFGHIHEGWGAKKVVWRGAEASEKPSHFTDVDNERSAVVESLATLRKGRWESEEVGEEKKRRLEGYRKRGYVTARVDSDSVQQTLFVNAAIQGLEEGFQLP